MRNPAFHFTSCIAYHPINPFRIDFDATLAIQFRSPRGYEATRLQGYYVLVSFNDSILGNGLAYDLPQVRYDGLLSTRLYSVEDD